MTSGTQSSSNPQQLLGDAITALRATQPENAVLLARQAVELGLDDTTVWGVIALASRNMGDYEAAHEAADRAIAHEARNARAFVVRVMPFSRRTTPARRRRFISEH